MFFEAGIKAACTSQVGVIDIQNLCFDMAATLPFQLCFISLTINVINILPLTQ